CLPSLTRFPSLARGKSVGRMYLTTGRRTDSMPMTSALILAQARAGVTYLSLANGPSTRKTAPVSLSRPKYESGFAIALVRRQRAMGSNPASSSHIAAPEGSFGARGDAVG